MGWMIGAIAVLCVTNATAIWKWHQARVLNKTLSASADSFREWREWYDGYDDRLRREVYLARGGQWPKSWCPTQDTHEMAIELIKDQHNQIATFLWNTQPEQQVDHFGVVGESRSEDPDYEEHCEEMRLEAEAESAKSA